MTATIVRGICAAPIRLGMAVLLASVALIVGAEPTPTAAARPLVTGVSGVYDYSPPIFQQVRSTGANMIRITAYWPGIAPGDKPPDWQPENPADPHYDWAFLDRGITEAVQAGLTPVLLIDGAPSWAQRCQTPPSLDRAVCDPDPAALAAFATAAARRYSGQFDGLPQVRYWEGINEPNLSLFFFPQFSTAEMPLSPGLYRKLLNSFYAAVKAVNPANLVIAGGLGPIAIPKWTIGPMRFTRILLCMTGGRRPHKTKGDCEGGVHFDIFDIHPYTTGSPSHEGGPNDVELGDLEKLQTLLRAAGRAGRIQGSLRHTELWNTEFSWDSRPPDPGGLPMKILCRWTAEALYRSWRAGMTRFFWYSLRDDPEEPNRPFSETLQSGLFFRGPSVAQDQPKEVFYAFRFPFVAFPKDKGLSFWGRTPTSGQGPVAIQLWRGGRWSKALVARADRNGIFHGIVHGSYGKDKTGLARAVYKGQAGVPFSMRPVGDFHQPPFG